MTDPKDKNFSFEENSSIIIIFQISRLTVINIKLSVIRTNF